jgi:hypothetical protein
MLLVIARGLFVACALSGFGAALFALTMPIARHVDARLRASIERQVRKIISLSLAAALVVGYAWLPLETHAVASTTNLAQTVTAIPTVLFDTRFGQVLAAGYCDCVRAGCEMARAEHFGRFARRPCRDARSWAQPCLCHGTHSLAAVADVAPDGCRRLARRAASASHRSPRGAARGRATRRQALLYPRYDLGQRACRHRAFSGDAAFGRTYGTHRNCLRRGVAVESRLVRTVDLDRRRQSLSLDTGVRRTGCREGQKGSRAHHWDRNCSRSLRGVCREPAQQPRAWNAYGNPRSVTPRLWPLARVLAKMA